MGLFRNIRRSKLKKQLIKEAELNQYVKQFDVTLEKLNNVKLKYIDMVKQGKTESNQDLIDLGIQYTVIVQENIKKIMQLKNTLEAARLSLDNQDAYNQFVEAVSAYTDTIKEQKTSKNKTRRTMNKHVRETKHLAQHMSMVDDKISKIEKNMKNSLDMDTSKKQKPIDQEAFMKEFNIE